MSQNIISSKEKEYRMKQRTYIFSHFLAFVVRMLSYFPLRVLYLLANVIYFLMAYVFAYRKKVILTNLRNSFPEKSEKLIRRIAKGFYRHLADVIVETISLLRISDKELKRRCRFSEESEKLLHHYYDRGQSVIGLLGHVGNWEWIPPIVTLTFPFHVIPAYRPLRDLVFDKLMLRVRGRHSHDLVSKYQVGRAVIRYRKSEKPFILGLISDQTPQPKGAIWTTFLSQDTPVNSGPEKLARTFEMPVIFAALRKERRGQYVMHIERLTDTPNKLPEGELTRLFMQRLEGEIRACPEYWLWSHRRWKYKRD